MPGAQRLVVAGDEVRVLVALETDAVPGPVEERLAVARPRSDRARAASTARRRDAGANGPRGRGLRALEDLEQVPEAFVRSVARVAAGHPQRARDVGAVAAERAADVEHDRLAGLDDPVGCLVVRRRGVRARSDDRELGLVVALRDQPLADLARDVGLRAPDQPAAGDLPDDAIGGVCGLRSAGRSRRRP